MARKKKSRKIGLIGVRKTPDFKRVEKEKRSKKSLGNPAGNRNSLAANPNDANKLKANKDPRLGSKKPVDLTIPVNEVSKIIKAKPLIKHFSPESELAQIEADEKLAQLVSNLDSGIKLDKSDQLYVTKNLARHKELCALLGIANDTEQDEQIHSSDDENDLYEKFEKIDVNKLNNF